MSTVNGALHTRQVLRAQRGQKRVVGVFYEEVGVVLESMKVSPSLCFVHIPKIVGSSAQHDGQVGPPGSGHRQTETAHVQHPLDAGALEGCADSQLLLLVTRHDDPKNPTAFG